MVVQTTKDDQRQLVQVQRTPTPQQQLLVQTSSGTRQLLVQASQPLREGSYEPATKKSVPAPVAKKAAPALVAKKAAVRERSFSENSGEEEKPAAQPVTKLAAAKEERNSDFNSDDPKDE